VTGPATTEETTVWHTPPLRDGDRVVYVRLAGRPAPRFDYAPGVIVGDPTGVGGATVRPYDPGLPEWTVGLDEVRRPGP